MVQPADQQFFARLAELNEKFAARLPETLDRLAALSLTLAPACGDAGAAGAGGAGHGPGQDDAQGQATVVPSVQVSGHAYDPAQPVSELQAMLHTLAGSAATFGFRGLGHHARLLEQRLRVLRTFDAVASSDWQVWQGELDAFIGAARQDPKALN